MNKRVAVAFLSFLYCIGSINGAATLQGWIFPGEPACDAPTTYHQNQIDTLKPQYFNINEDGSVSVLNDAFTCNAYSDANVADVKGYSKHQFATTACQYTAFNALIHDSAKVDAAIKVFLSTMQQAKLTGVEIDCENYEQWTADDSKAFIAFLVKLGDTLHSNGFQLMIDGPAIDTTDTQSGVPNFKYEDYENVPQVDYVCVMAYDNQLGAGTGQAVGPDGWTTNVVNWLKSKITNSDRIVIGIGSYGYHGPVGGSTADQKQDTKAQSMKYPGFSTATRDPSSQEMMWTSDGVFYDYADTTTMDHRRELVEGLGIKAISVWHLGGNDWFSGASAVTEPTVQTSAAMKTGASAVVVVAMIMFAIFI